MELHEIAIIGSGPAAYQASIYLREYPHVLFEGEIIGNNGPGGQLTTTTDVDNFPGFPSGVQGPELISIMQSQIKAEVIPKTVTKLMKNKENLFEIYTDDRIYNARIVIVATGAIARRLFVPGTNDDEYWQKGISSCAICDGWAFLDKTVVVIGGGDSAMEEALYLASIAKKVILVHRRNKFRARDDMLGKVKKNSKIEIKTPFELVKAEGGEFLEKIIVKNTEDLSIEEIETEGLFFGIGHDPNSEFLCDAVKKDAHKYIITDEAKQASVEGMFVCGDVQDAKYRQAITAAGSGCIAAISAMKYLRK